MSKKKKTVLIIGGDPKVDWDGLFKDRTLIDGTPVEAIKTTWDSIVLNGYSEGGCVVTCTGRSDTIQPDIVLVRGALRGAYPTDHRNILIGFAFCGVRCVNSARSLWLCQDKPLVYAALRDVQRRLGADRFPLIPQSYWPGWRSVTFADGFPLVAKVGTVHAGLGKMKIANQQELHDFRSVLAMQGNYATGEPFIDWDYDFRLQKIGPHCRGFRRTSDVWKGASMASRDNDEPLTELQKLWLDEVSAALGMDVIKQIQTQTTITYFMPLLYIHIFLCVCAVRFFRFLLLMVFTQRTGRTTLWRSMTQQ